MASDTQAPELSSAFERLLRHRDLSFFMPFLLGFTSSTTIHQRENANSENPDRETSRTNSQHERIILINPFTQGMVVIEGTASLDSLLSEFAAKNGQPPASKASIEAMPSVEFGEIGDEDGECTICLEEWELGRVVKEMPCKHRFHGDCIEKWLGIHGSCPVCRYTMPVDEAELDKKRDQEDEEEEEEGRERRRIEREIWVNFSFNRNRRNENSNQTPSTDANDADTTPDQEMQN